MGLPGAESTDRVKLLARIGATVDVRVSLVRANAPTARVLPCRRVAGREQRGERRCSGSRSAAARPGARTPDPSRTCHFT